MPGLITLDAYAASHPAVQELKSEGRLPKRVRVRSSKYLNNMIKQDPRRIKQRTKAMLGFKRFANAAVTICGIELVQKIQKHQFKKTPPHGARIFLNECLKQTIEPGSGAVGFARQSVCVRLFADSNSEVYGRDVRLFLRSPLQSSCRN